MTELIFNSLLRSTSAQSIVLLLVFALRPLLLRRYGASCAYLSWLLLPVLLVAASLPASAPGHSLQLMLAVDAALPSANSNALLAVDRHALLMQGLLGLWLLGSVVIALEITRRQRRFIAALQLTATHWQAPAGSGPALVGLWHPRLCLPADFEQRFTPQERALILAHERVHRQRADNAWNLLACMICTLQWFNPLAWLGWRLMRVDQELSCDAAVLREQPNASAAYARALVAAQHPHLAKGLPWASWRSSHPLIERVSMLKQHSQARRGAGLRLLAVMALIGAGTVHALQSTPAPERPGAAEQASVSFALDIEVKQTQAEKTSSWRAKTRLVSPLGHTVRFRIPIHARNEPADTAEQIEVTLIARELGDRRLLIETQIRRGEPWRTLAAPRLIVSNGEAARIAGDGDDGYQFNVGVTASLVTPKAPA